MAEAESPPEKTTVNIRMTESFLEDVDVTWKEYGFNSRSEFIRAVLRDALKGIADPGAQIFQIRLLDDESKVVGYLPFRYKQSADFEDGRYGIDAIVYLHNEEALQPEQRFWSSRWRYYDDFPEARPLSMLVPPKGNVDSVESDQEDPVVLVHGVSGRYPSWGNDIKKARSLVKHLSSKGYDGWQFFYPENQDITKSGPLLAKAIYRLRSDLGYDSDQKFDLVAHSMGGLVSRHYVQTMGIGPLRTPYSQVVDNLPDPDSAIEKFLMLGTPNHGSLGSFKCTGGNLNTCDFLKDYLEKDPGAPAYVQMTPGSRFLSDLNRSDEAPESYSPSSTLVLAGTRNPSFDVGVTLSVEIPEQDDGVVAVSSASMLDLGVPLATGDFTHSAGLDVDGLGDPRLNEDTDAIITNFLSDAYDPTVPANLGNITGFWGENKAGSTDPEPTYENGLSADTDKGILTINTDGITITELGIKWPCLPDGFGTDPEVCVRIGSEAGMEKVPRQSRFFSRSVALSVGEGYAPTIASGIAAKTNRTAVIQEEHLGGTWKKIGTMPLTTKNLHTTQNTLSLDDQQQAIVEAGSTTPSVGGSISAKNGSATSSRSLAPKDAQTTSTEFQVSAATDTLSFWLAQDSTGDFSSHNMRLVTPGGSVIDSSEAKSEPEFGYSQDLGLGYAIYLVTDPTPGRWTVRYDGSVNASVSAPVKGAIDLQASMPDSVYTTEETVPVSVSVSDQNSYQSVEVSAQLRIEDAEDGDIKTLGSVDLSKSGATTYEGEFSPSYVGSHQVSVDFSATVEGESVLRRTVETVEVIGDSMDTPPDPLPAPTNLSAQIEEDVVVSWSAPSTGSVDEYRIYRDTIPNPTQRVGKVSAGQTSYTDTGVQNRQTYYYRITAVGTNGVESDFTEEVSIFSYPSSLSVNVQRTFGDPSGEQGYRLVALPGAVEEPLDAVTGGEAGADWQAFWDDGSSQDYFRKYDGSDTFSFRPGRGFWVLKRSGWSVQRSIETVSLSGRSQTTIPLHEGWNIISNPFGGDLSWAQVDAANSDSLRALWRFDGSFAQADTFRSAKTGEAFYFLNDTGLDSLSVPYPSGPSIRAKQKEKSSLLSISARPEGLESPASTVKIGFDEEAAGGLGRLDQPAPPGQFSAISLRLKASGDVPDRQRWLAAEKRPPSTEVNGGGYTFDLRLRSQVEGPVRISASGLKAVEDKEVELLHPSTGESYDLKSGEPVTLQETDSTALRLAVGTAAYVQDQADKVVPDEVTLTSYPNPMSRQATLEYTLPEAKEVRLAVYDVLGRRVATLKQGRMEAGRHRARLQGDQLSSGVYFGRLKVGDQTRTQKITVVR